jgi:hypothetical protein
MKILTLKLSKISAEKKADLKENMNFKSNFSLGEFKVESLHGKEKDIYSISFKHSMDYEDVANICFEGKIYMMIDDKKLAKEFESRKISKDLKEQLLNFLLWKIHVDTLQIEEKLGLPFHIRSPIVSFKDKEDN